MKVSKVSSVLKGKMSSLLTHIALETKRVASTNGGEHAGPCPRCGGTDRFRLWPDEDETGRFWCRGCEWSGDGIDLLRSDAGGALTFAEACRALGVGYKIDARGDGQASWPGDGGAQRFPRPPKPPAAPRLLRPPGVQWQERARAFVEECRRALWQDTAAARSARSYLTGRGLTEETIRAAGLGVNTRARRPLRTNWGLEPREEKRDGGCLWLPRGIVIPWWESGEEGARLWKVVVRRPRGDVANGGGPKYVQAAAVRPPSEDGPGWASNALYGASALRPGRPAVLVEGAFDALAVMQEARTAAPFPKGRALVAAVACGTAGGRRPRWIAQLARCYPVLIAFDVDENGAGEEAATYWAELLPNAVRHAPAGAAGDPADMLRAGEDLRAWISKGLRAADAGARLRLAPLPEYASPPIR